MRTLRPAAAIAVALFAATLAACDGGSPEGTGDGVTPPVESASASPAPADSPVPADAPPECDDLLLASDTQVSGQQLGDCMAAAMLAAGSGVHRVDSSDGTSSIVEFEWDPEFAMSIEGEQRVVVRGDDGWLYAPETGWVKSDPSSGDPLVQQATTIVELVRVAGSPEVLAGLFATAPTWTLDDDLPVPADDSVAESAWRLTPDDPLDLGGVELSDVELWLTPDYLGAYFVGTGTYGGVSVTTSNTFLEWGGAVDIPDPAAEG
ncbi:hypothetical protein [Microbacterium suaedae]|uniref:hypothetical protein n=1 Tax=Microbacterium suaedae TaxID=2067813 RepID=UPI000DA22EDF|nr:hypothetical protein [Microbacterium suaedae]